MKWFKNLFKNEGEKFVSKAMQNGLELLQTPPRSTVTRPNDLSNHEKFLEHLIWRSEQNATKIVTALRTHAISTAEVKDQLRVKEAFDWELNK